MSLRPSRQPSQRRAGVTPGAHDLRVVRPIAVLALVAGAMLLQSRAPVASALERVRDLASAPAESVGLSTERLHRLDTTMQRMVDEGRLAGAVTMLTRHGKIAHVTVNGKRDVRQSDPLRRDDIFRIASMTKPVTGVAMMMLYEEGK